MKIEANEFAKAVPFMGERELIQYYRKADLLVLASHTKTFGFVFVEAISQSVPVIYIKGEGFD